MCKFKFYTEHVAVVLSYKASAHHRWGSLTTAFKLHEGNQNKIVILNVGNTCIKYLIFILNCQTMDLG